MSIQRATALSLLVALALLAPAPVAVAGTAGYGGLDLVMSVQINDLACTTFAVQCADLGSPFEPPVEGNNAAVMVVVQLLDLRHEPILGLVESDFAIVNRVFPAGGSAVEIVSCSGCFFDLDDGVYTLWLQPAVGEVWDDGTYVAQLQADIGPKVLRSLIRLDVPPAS